MNTEQTELAGRIRSAFIGTKLGDGISLNMTEYHDSYGGETKFKTLAKHDERHDWQSIPDQVLEQFTVTFAFTDINGFRFYLPAYMTWTLKNHLTSDSIIGDFTIYAIDTGHHLFENRAMTSVFTRDQLACMVEFLKYCLKHDGHCDGKIAGENLQKLVSEMARRSDPSSD